MKLKLLFGLLLVVGMIGIGSAAEENGNGAYDEPQVYNNDSKIVAEMYLVYDSDDSLTNADGPDGDGILYGLDSIFTPAPELDLIYN